MSYQDMVDGKVRALYVMEADPAAGSAAARPPVPQQLKR